jgi:tetratricopeptide (TPR) repeat protein
VVLLPGDAQPQELSGCSTQKSGWKPRDLLLSLRPALNPGAYASWAGTARLRDVHGLTELEEDETARLLLSLSLGGLSSSRRSPFSVKGQGSGATAGSPRPIVPVSQPPPQPAARGSAAAPSAGSRAPASVRRPPYSAAAAAAAGTAITIELDQEEEDEDRFRRRRGASSTPEPGAASREEEGSTPVRNARRLFNKAKIMIMQERASEAIRSLEQSLKLDPDSPKAYEAWLLLGKLRMGNPMWNTRAIEALQAASRLQTKAAEPWALMGDLYLRKSFKANAIGCFKKALELDPSVPIPELNLAEDAGDIMNQYL